MPYDLDRLAQHIAEEDYVQLDELFTRVDKPPPDLTWDPAADTIPDRRLVLLLDYWRSLRVNGQDIPSAGAIDPLAMKFALGYLLLSDVVRGGDDYRYRVYGSTVAALSGSDLTGRHASDFGDGRSLFYISTYKAILLRRQPLYVRFDAISVAEVESWWRLVLPLAGADGEIVRFLSVMVPETMA
ncbi:MAG: PAS domain-containing protein [Alphaproteobacteria bacterium]|nr:PAS domain-containing protein [Alphaproteobacteria bacterium]